MLLRNDQSNGPHQVMWTGNVDPVWITYASNSANSGYAGSENGYTAGHILYTALNILQTPSIWNQPVPDGNPNNFGVILLRSEESILQSVQVATIRRSGARPRRRNANDLPAGARRGLSNSVPSSARLVG
jgi:hypothetical protein